MDEASVLAIHEGCDMSVLKNLTWYTNSDFRFGINRSNFKSNTQNVLFGIYIVDAIIMVSSLSLLNED